MFVQVAPESVERYTPSPWETLLRMHASPVPAYTTDGSASATARAPMAEVRKKPSDVLRQYVPPSVDFQTPPAHAPK